MKNAGHIGGVVRRTTGKANGGFLSLRSISGYLRIVSSGASTIASTVKSAGVSVVSSLAEDDTLRDQVQWAGFDTLEIEDNACRQVLLLGYRSGFEVWDVQEADDVRKLASRRDGPISFLQVQKSPIASKRSQDVFADVRPLLVVAGDGSTSNGLNNHDRIISHANNESQDLGNRDFIPTSIQFFSLKSNAFIHVLKFRSAIYSIRCSPRVVAVLQASQIYCFDAATLEMEYTIITNPIVSGPSGPGGIGYGPLAVGSRWLAYSGSPVAISNTGRVSPQHLTPATNFSTTLSNGSIVAYYAKESSKQLASGIVTLGDMGYKKLSRYCSEVLLQDGNNSLKQRSPSAKTSGTLNGHPPDTENIGMVIVRDLVSKSVVSQFRAHRSPISALCFNPSGMLLVTASIRGHNINIFHVIPSSSGSSTATASSGTYVHLYRLQRGFTNAVIQDISFSNDSKYIMISSSRGTSHLFALSLSGDSPSHPYNISMMNGSNGSSLTPKSSVRWPPGSGSLKSNQNNLFSTSLPITLSVISRIKNGSNGWKGTVSGAAAAATGTMNPICGAIASTFHNCKGTGVHPDLNSLGTKCYLLVFSPSGCIIQYVLHHLVGAESGTDLPGLNFCSNELSQDTNMGILVEALQKWDVCHKQNRRDHNDDVDIYGENQNGDNTSLTKGFKRGTTIHPVDSVTENKKLTAEEKLRLYISEVELHMHPARVPLWARQDIYFQVIDDFSEDNYASSLNGEIEIERIPTRTVEARSTDLKPAFDYLHMPRYQQPSRINVAGNNQIGTFASPKSCLSDDVLLQHRSFSGSIDCMSESNVNDLPNFVQNCWSEHASSELGVAFVNNCGTTSVNNQVICVTNSEGSKA